MDRMTQEDRIKHYAHLIQRQTGKAVRPYRADGYVNMVNRYGTSKDSSEQYNFVPEASVPDEVLEMHYEGNGLFAKIIDMPAEEAVKHGFTLEDVEDGKLADFYSEALDELNWEETAMTAVKWARLFGGSIAVMLVNDGRGLEEPLDWKNIQSIDDIRVYDRSIIQPDYSSIFNYDPVDPFRVRGSRLGMPEYYDVFSRYGSFRVHDSRCLVFQNGVLPENTSNSIYQFWGIPEYIRLNKAIRDADIAHRSAPKLLERSVQPIYKMRGLASELATEQGEDRILKRLQVLDTSRGILNSLVIDAEGEDYDFKTFQYNGITDVISASCNMLAALSNIPQVILFGQSISGMSSTDDTSMENYYNFVERIQKRMLRSNLRYLLSVVFQAGLATGEVDEVPKIKVQFNPLWSVSDSEQAALDQQKAQTELTKAQTAQAYVGMEAIDPSEVRAKLADSDEFDVENMLDEYTDEELEAGMPSNNNEEQAQAPDGQPAIPDGNDEKAGPGQLLNEKNLSAIGNNAKEPSAMEAKVSVDPHENDPGTEGDEPASAPAATKQPADMSPEEKAKAAQARQNQKKDREDMLHTDDNNSHSKSNGGSVGVIVVNNGKILNGTRHNDFGYGLVCGPGGHIEDGETPEQAAFRETKEEFGIMPESLMWLGQGPKEKDMGLQPYLFLCTEYSGTPNCEDLEMTGAKFSTLEELNEKAESMFGPFADGLKILMDCLETGIFYTDPAEGVTDEKLNAHLEKAMNTDDDDWITVNGTHVMIDESRIAKNGGGLKGKSFSRVSSHGGSNSSLRNCGLHKLSKHDDFTRDTDFASAILKLRRGKEPNEKEQRIIKQADDSMETIQTELSLYRGSTAKIENGVFSKEEQDGWSSYGDVAASWVGKEFSDKGYMYTSTDESEIGRYTTEYKLVITAKPGTKAIWGTGSVGDEIILGRNQKFRCTNAHADENDRITLEVEVSNETMLNGDGGPGSGNFGHKGVPGQVGGSAPSDSSNSGSSTSSVAEKLKKLSIGEKITAHNNGFDCDTVLEKKDYGWIDSATGQLWDEKDIVNPDNYSSLSLPIEVEPYNGRTDFEGGSVSQDILTKKKAELSRNLSKKESSAKLTDSDVENMVGAVKNYGSAGICQEILSAQDDNTYSELRDGMSDSEKKWASEQAKQLDRFIELSDKVQTPIYRGMTFNSAVDQNGAGYKFVKSLKVGSTIELGHIASWTDNYGTASNYAEGVLDAGIDEGENYSIIMQVDSPKTAVSLSGINPEGECLSPKYAKYRVSSVRDSYYEDDRLHYYTVDLEEV